MTRKSEDHVEAVETSESGQSRHEAVKNNGGTEAAGPADRGESVVAEATAQPAKRWLSRKWLIIGGSVVAGIALITTILVLASRTEVPDLIGMSPTEARQAIEDAGLSWDEESLSWVRSLDQEFQVVANQVPAAGEGSWRGGTIELDMEPMSVETPGFVGLTLAEASEVADELGLKLEGAYFAAPDSGSWAVLEQRPAAGASGKAGDTVTLVLELPNVVIPQVVGRPLNEVFSALLAAGFEVRIGTAGSESDWEVVGVSPEAGVEALYGTEVIVEVLPPFVDVPSVVGLTRDQAARELESLGFVVKTPDSSGSDWNVVSQSAVGPGEARKGTTITLGLSEPRIVFSVTGNGSRALITWTVPGNSFSIGQDANARLPWSISFPMTSGYRGNLSAQMWNGTSITCTITVNGRVVETITSTGSYAIAMCGG